MWSRNPAVLGGGDIWTGAIDNAYNLTLCGYTDWQLPNVVELESLINAGGELSPDFWLNGEGFYNVPMDRGYWSSTSDAYISEYGSGYGAWCVELFGDRVVGTKWNGVAGTLNYAWPVRSGSGGCCLTAQNRPNDKLPYR